MDALLISALAVIIAIFGCCLSLSRQVSVSNTGAFPVLDTVFEIKGSAYPENGSLVTRVNVNGASRQFGLRFDNLRTDIDFVGVAFRTPSTTTGEDEVIYRFLPQQLKDKSIVQSTFNGVRFDQAPIPEPIVVSGNGLASLT